MQRAAIKPIDLSVEVQKLEGITFKNYKESVGTYSIVTDFLSALSKLVLQQGAEKALSLKSNEKGILEKAREPVWKCFVDDFSHELDIYAGLETPDYSRWKVICVRRTWIEVFNQAFKKDMAPLDTESIDYQIRLVAEDFPIEKPEAPAYIPEEHWWWKLECAPKFIIDYRLLEESSPKTENFEETAGVEMEPAALKPIDLSEEVRKLKDIQLRNYMEFPEFYPIIKGFMRAVEKLVLQQSGDRRLFLKSDEREILEKARQTIQRHYVERLCRKVCTYGVSERSDYSLWKVICLQRTWIEFYNQAFRKEITPLDAEEVDMMIRVVVDDKPIERPEAPAYIPEEHWWWRLECASKFIVKSLLDESSPKTESLEKSEDSPEGGSKRGSSLGRSPKRMKEELEVPQKEDLLKD